MVEFFKFILFSDRDRGGNRGNYGNFGGDDSYGSRGGSRGMGGGGRRPDRPPQHNDDMSNPAPGDIFLILNNDKIQLYSR